MEHLVYITKAEQTPYITNDGFQKVMIRLKSRFNSLELWGKIKNLQGTLKMMLANGIGCQNL